jgi:uncharacterized protein YgiM (DUF1202 family)
VRFVAPRITGLHLIWLGVLIALLCSTLAFALQPVWASPRQQSTDSASGAAVIVADARVNLRAGPGTTYRILAKLTPGDPITVLGRAANPDWLRIRVEATGQTGWVAADLVQVQPAGRIALLPTPTVDALLAATQNQQAASELLTTFPNPDETTGAVAATTTTNDATITASAMTSANTSDDVDQFTAPAEGVASIVGPPQAVTRPANMNVRGGPGTQYAVVSTAPAGTVLPILAQGPNRDWYKVEIDGVEEAWISASLVQTSGQLDGLATFTADQTPPPPEPAPVAVAVSASASAAPAAVVDAPPPAGGGFFAYGIQAHLWQNSEKNFVAGQIRDIGFTWVKSQLRWEFVENSPGNVNWSEPDQIIEVMTGNGIQVLFSIFTAPQWSRPNHPGTGGPPDDFNLYAEYVGKVAQRYCGRLGAIEVWNEQNLQREWEGYPLDPAQYMDLLRRAYGSIKANCPSVLVISGAPTPAGNSPVAVDDVEYLRGMYAHGLARYSDGVGVHPSGFANPPEVTIQDWQAGRYTAPPSHFDHRSFYFRSTMEEYRAVMVAAGDVNKRLWPTEFGWGSTSTPHPGYEYEAYITESTQAQYIVRAYLLMREWGWVGVPFLWNLNFSEGEMAAFRVAGRPAYDALKTLPK